MANLKIAWWISDFFPTAAAKETPRPVEAFHFLVGYHGRASGAAAAVVVMDPDFVAILHPIQGVS